MPSDLAGDAQSGGLAGFIGLDLSASWSLPLSLCLSLLRGGSLQGPALCVILQTISGGGHGLPGSQLSPNLQPGSPFYQNAHGFPGSDARIPFSHSLLCTRQVIKPESWPLSHALSHLPPLGAPTESPSPLNSVASPHPLPPPFLQTPLPRAPHLPIVSARMWTRLL